MTKEQKNQFAQILQREVLPTYSTTPYGKYVLLFSHIHALIFCDVIQEKDVLFNFSDFCRLLSIILNDKKFSRSKAYLRFYYPTKHQCELTEKIYQKYIGNNKPVF